MSGEKETEGIKRKKKKNDWIVYGAVLVAFICLAASVAYQVFNGTSGTKHVLKISGSTTVQPIASKAAEKYMDAHSDVDIQVSGGGSGAGITAIGQGTVDIGMSSRELKSSEMTQYPSLKTTTIAKDGIAIIVHKSNSVSHLSLVQIRGIYNGTYTNWNQLGGTDKTIVVYGRDSSSGTRDFFSSAVMKMENYTVSQHELNSNGAIQTAVSQTEGAVGYVGLGFVDSSIKALKIDTTNGQVEASVANVLNGKYPISRPLIMITKGSPVGLGKEFIDYILSAEGQKIVEEEGFVPLP
jgi:phosphate transport system substrate-binding protein